MTKKKKWRAVGVFNSFGTLVGIGLSPLDAWFYVENDYLGELAIKEWKKRGFTQRKVWVLADAPQEEKTR